MCSPAWAMSVSSPSVRRVTVFPPVLGPVITRVRKRSPSGMSTGTTGGARSGWRAPRRFTRPTSLRRGDPAAQGRQDPGDLVLLSDRELPEAVSQGDDGQGLHEDRHAARRVVVHDPRELVPVLGPDGHHVAVSPDGHEGLPQVAGQDRIAQQPLQLLPQLRLGPPTLPAKTGELGARLVADRAVLGHRPGDVSLQLGEDPDPFRDRREDGDLLVATRHVPLEEPGARQRVPDPEQVLRAERSSEGRAPQALPDVVEAPEGEPAGRLGEPPGLGGLPLAPLHLLAPGRGSEEEGLLAPVVGGAHPREALQDLGELEDPEGARVHGRPPAPRASRQAGATSVRAWSLAPILWRAAPTRRAGTGFAVCPSVRSSSRFPWSLVTHTTVSSRSTSSSTAPRNRSNRSTTSVESSGIRRWPTRSVRKNSNTVSACWAATAARCRPASSGVTRGTAAPRSRAWAFVRSW